MQYNPPAKKCKLDFQWLGPYLVVSIARWAVRVQLQPGSLMIFVHCQDIKENSQPRLSWLLTPDQPELGASTVGGSASRSDASSVTGLPSALSLPQSSLPLLPLIQIGPGHMLHPFSVNHFDAGPVCLASIAHAFNYRVAMLRDGIKQATRTSRSKKAERSFLDDVALPWVIVRALAGDVPAASGCITDFHSVSPDVLLSYEPWGHAHHACVNCGRGQELMFMRFRLFMMGQVLMLIRPLSVSGA